MELIQNPQSIFYSIRVILVKRFLHMI